MDTLAAGGLVFFNTAWRETRRPPVTLVIHSVFLTRWPASQYQFPRQKDAMDNPLNAYGSICVLANQLTHDKSRMYSNIPQGHLHASSHLRALFLPYASFTPVLPPTTPVHLPPPASCFFHVCFPSSPLPHATPDTKHIIHLTSVKRRRPSGDQTSHRYRACVIIAV